MPIFPIPSAYVETGLGPNKIARRDGDGNIPGVVSLVERMAPYEVAQQQRQLSPSGWLTTPRLIGSAELAVPGPNILGVSPGARAMVQGFLIPLESSLFLINLPSPPTTGLRYDQVFLECFFQRTSNGKTLVARWRVLNAADVLSTQVYDETGTPTVGTTYVPAASLAATFPELAREPDLIVGVLPGLQNDAVSERSVANTYKRLFFLLPAFMVKRLNSTTYHPVNNANGAPVGPTSDVRPDGLTNNYLKTEAQAIFAGPTVLGEVSVDSLLHAALHAVLTNRPQYKNGQGFLGVARQEVAGSLTDFDRYYSNFGTVRLTHVATNLVKASHFRQDSNTDGVSDMWAIHSAGSGAGTMTFLNPGQRVNKSGGTEYGLKQTVTGLRGRSFRGNLKFAASALGSAKVRVELAATDGGAAIFTIEKTQSELAAAGYQIQFGYTHSTWLGTLALRVSIVNDNGSFDLSYVDVSTSLAGRPAMEVDTTGTMYTLDAPVDANKWAYEAANHTSGRSPALPVNPILGTYALSAGKLRFTSNGALTTTDFRLGVSVNFKASTNGDQSVVPQSGLLRVNSAVAGTMPDTPAIENGVDVRELLAEELGLSNYATNESARVYNPFVQGNGICATIAFAGSGTNTVTLPATKFGLNVLPIPISIQKGSGVSFADASATALNVSTRVLTLSQPVDVGQTLLVEVPLEAPFAVYDEAGGVEGIYQATATDIVPAASLDVALAPARAAGELMALANSEWFKPVYVNTSGFLQGTVSVNVVFEPGLGARISGTSALGTNIIGAFGVMRLSLDRLSQPTASAFYFSSAEVAPWMSIEPDASNGAPALTVRVLSRPVVFAHTKGFGAVDPDSPWGRKPLSRNGTLKADALSLSGQGVSIGSVLEELPVYVSGMAKGPIVSGRAVRVAHGAADFKVVGPLLGTSYAHEVVVAFLVEYNGLLLVAIRREVRADNQNSVGPGRIELYVLPGTPVSYTR